MGYLVSVMFLLLAEVAFPSFAVQAASQQEEHSQVRRQKESGDEVLFKYLEFLRAESKEHREFLERYYSLTAAGLGAVALIFGALLTWLNWKTKEEIRKQVEEQYRSHAQGLVEEKIRQFDKYLSETQARFDQQFKEINKVLLDLSARGTSTTSTFVPDIGKLSGKRILWVDDFPQNNEYPRRILEEAGVQFDLARSTEQGLALAKGGSYNLIISDMARGKNHTAGLDLLRELRSLATAVPVIIYASARAVEQTREQAKALGAREVITGSSLLLQTVHRLLGAARNNDGGGLLKHKSDRRHYRTRKAHRKVTNDLE